MILTMMMTMMMLTMSQVVERREGEAREREVNQAQQEKHFQSWDTFWGRPGYGAPRYYY